MKIRICLLIILMGLLYPGYISSQESPYVFRQIGVVEGLPDNYVKSVFPIPDGRIGVRHGKKPAESGLLKKRGRKLHI